MITTNKSKSKFVLALRREKRYWQLYALLLLPTAFVIIFSYWPMYGIQIAFKDFSATKGIFGSPWVGLKYFEQFFGTSQLLKIIKNTLIISLTTIILSFPIPIIFAIALNELKNKTFSKAVQTVTYAPYFISTVVLVGMIFQLTDPRIGPITSILNGFGLHDFNIMGESSLFLPVYVLSDMWQYTGYSSIVYLAVLAGVDPELQEAATIDGATKLQRIWNVEIPHLMPTATILLVLSMGNVLTVDFQKVFLMQTPLTISSSEVISTYVYKVGMKNAQFSLATAIGLFSAVVNLVLLLMVNKIAKKFSGSSLF